MHKGVKVNTYCCDDLQLGKKNIKTHTVCCNQVYDGKNIYPIEQWNREDNSGDESTIEQLERENEEKQLMIERLTQENNIKQTTIVQLERENDGKDYTIEQLERENEEKQTTITQLDQEAEESKTVIEQLEQEKEENQTTIDGLRQEINDKQTIIDGLRQEVNDSKHYIKFNDFSFALTTDTDEMYAIGNWVLEFPIECEIKYLTEDEMLMKFVDDPNINEFVILLYKKSDEEFLLICYCNKRDYIKRRLLELIQSGKFICLLYQHIIETTILEEGEFFNKGELNIIDLDYKIGKYITFEIKDCPNIECIQVTGVDEITGLNIGHLKINDL